MEGTDRTDRVTIRAARAADVGYIGSLSKIAFHEYGPYEAMLPEWFQSGTTVTLLAVIEERPVGFVMIRRLWRESHLHGVSELLAIAVEPSKRKLGIGELLLKEIQRVANRTGVQTLVLHTAVGNTPGQRLFRKYGFIALEVKANFYPNGQDALMMYKDINVR